METSKAASAILESKGSWIPPLKNSFHLYTEFKRNIASGRVGKINYSNAISSFEKGVLGTNSEFSIPEPSAGIGKILKEKVSISLDSDSYSRIFLHCRELQYRLVQNPPKKNKEINLHVGSFRIFKAIVTQPKTKRHFGFQNSLDETLAQDSDADSFMFHIAAQQGINFEMAFWVWDILLYSSLELIYRTKKQFGYRRPRRNNMPSIPTPLHSTWPGGHAFSAGALATFLYWMLKDRAKDPKSLKSNLEKAATRIAQIREDADLHWQEDTMDGLKIGAMTIRGLIEDYGRNSKSADIIQLLRLARKF